MVDSIFIDAIRADVLSGGRTSSDLFLKSNKIDIYINISPGKLGFLQVIKYFPMHFFLVFYRLVKLDYLEFLIRVSFFTFLRLLFISIFYRPGRVYFNHHSSYIYSIIFFYSEKIFIAHDLIAVKSRYKYQNGFVHFLCLAIERFFLKGKDVFFFSFTDLKYAGLFIKPASVNMLPIIDTSYSSKNRKFNNRFCLIGNWARVENWQGALVFFETLHDRFVDTDTDTDTDRNFKYILAGSGSNSFYKRIIQKFPFLSSIVEPFEGYKNISDLDCAVLIAPIISGAGIKLKTLESFQSGMIVLGTAQAFTGLSNNFIESGGYRFPEISDIVSFVYSEKFLTFLENKSPSDCITLYKSKLRINNDCSI